MPTDRNRAAKEIQPGGPLCYISLESTDSISGASAQRDSGSDLDTTFHKGVYNGKRHSCYI
jgi:hypothetical protein